MFVSVEHVLTDGLDWRCPDPEGDLAALFAIVSDPESWWYDPSDRHTEPRETHDWLIRAAARFGTDGLSYWTMRRRDDSAMIGVDGAQRQRTGAWNLNYLIHTHQQGRRYATEVARQAQQLATDVDDTVPVIAWIAEHNIQSRRVAEHLALTNYGLAINPSDGLECLAYADRPSPKLHRDARAAA